MAVNKVVYGDAVLVDLTGDSVTPDKLAKGETAHDASGEPITGTMHPGIDTSDATATEDDMAEGVTAYVNGEKVTGNVPVWSGASWETPTAVWDDSNSRLRLYGKTPVKRIYESSSTFDMYCAGEKLGDATAADVAEGKTFTSAVGLKVTGTHKCAGGGSSDNNCEAYHITSASATLNFKTSGTVKVWGYGAKKSTYTTTLYAFVGDGYYTGMSYGTPSKTSATFSIASDGTLSGLPSGLTGLDVLVTVGV